MSSPQSLKQTFLSLPKYEWADVLSDDYCHKKLETVKFKANTDKKGTLNYKGVWDLKTGDNKKPVFSLSDEVKFGLPFFDKYYCQMRFKRSGEIKYHLDFGNVKLANHDINLFGNIKTNPQFENLWMRLGMTYFGKHCESLNRVERDAKGNNMLVGKTVVKHGDLKAGLIGIFNLSNMALTKYDASVGYKHKKFNFALQHNSPANATGDMAIGKLMACVAYKINDDHRVAVQYKTDMTRGKWRVVLGGEAEVNKDLNLKAKIDSKGKTTLAGKYKWNKGTTVTVGTQLNLQNGAGAIDTSKIIPIPLGYTIETSI